MSPLLVIETHENAMIEVEVRDGSTTLALFCTMPDRLNRALDALARLRQPEPPTLTVVKGGRP
jgi:hypothetical protein